MEKVPFKNKFDQVIRPGDEVVMVASGYAHNVNIRKGIYLGMNENGPCCEWANVRSKWNFDTRTSTTTKYKHKSTLFSERVFLLSTPLSAFDSL